MVYTGATGTLFTWLIPDSFKSFIFTSIFKIGIVSSLKVGCEGCKVAGRISISAHDIAYRGAPVASSTCLIARRLYRLQGHSNSRLMNM